MATLQELVNAHEEACQACANFVTAVTSLNGDEPEEIITCIAACAEQAKIHMLDVCAHISKLIENKYEEAG